jgi:Winged helix DNA-binding domain
VRSFTIDERRARLARRHFFSAPAESVGGVAGSVIGLHATDPTTPYLSLWARLPGFTVADLNADLYQRHTVIKHLAMRRTLWMVRSDDLPFVQSCASNRVADRERRKLVADAQKAGIAEDCDRWLDTACAAVFRYLAVRGPTSAKDLRAALPELAGHYDPAPGKRWGGEIPLAPRVLTVLSVRGDIVRGPNDGAWTVSRPRWVPMDDWLPSTAVAVAPEVARAALVRRWLRTFGPATVTDVKWWFGNTLTWARQALRDIDAVDVDLDGTTGFALPDDLEEEPDVEPWCALLPGLDVTTMGWYDRDWYVGEQRMQVFDTNGNGGTTAWCNGRIVGGWGQNADGRIELRLLEDVGRDAIRALTHRADELTEWLGGVRVGARFPSPLTRAIENSHVT